MGTPDIDIVLARPGVTERALAEPPISESVELGHDVSVGPVEKALSREIVDLCEPKKVDTPLPETQDPIRYDFIRRLKVGPGAWNFDEDQRLVAAIALSRLAHPTSIGFEWSARVVLNEGGSIREAVPAHVGPAAFAYAVEGSRDWLTKPDVELTARLLDCYIRQTQTMADRVRRALWRHEYAARLEELDLRWLLVAGGLEWLLKLRYARTTRRPGSTTQFKRRTTALAAQLGLPWTDADAERAYELRSEVAHGARVSRDSADLPLYTAMETLLRTALRQALLDPVFQALFMTDTAVDTAFPS